MRDPIGVIFDLDGTLIDSAPDIHAAANRVFASYGLEPFEFATVRSFIGNGVGVLVARLLAHQNLPDAGSLHEEMVDRFISIYEEAVDLTSLYPNVVESLATLASLGHPMAICTNKPAAPALSVLRHFDLARYFAVIVGGDTLPQRKPDPAPLLAARTRLGTARIIFVGDSEVDAQTAIAAHVPFALYTNGYRSTEPEAIGAKAIFDDFNALPGLIRHLGARF